MKDTLYYCNRFQKLRGKKRPFEHVFSLISKFIRMKTMSFSDLTRYFDFTVIPEDLMNNSVHDISNRAVQSILGSIWPNGASSFRLVPHRELQDNEINRMFFKEVNNIFVDVMDDDQSGLPVALQEAIAEAADFGAGSVFVHDTDFDDDMPVRYSGMNVKEAFIDENRFGFVDTYYRFTRMTVREIISEYGKDNVHQTVLKKFDSGEVDEMIEVLICIEPKSFYEKDKEGRDGMAFESCHIDHTHKHKMRESGFREFPCPTIRFWKMLGEVWGRCPGIHSLPDVIQLNAIFEAVEIAYETFLRPPLALLDDGRLGCGSVDTSPDGLTVLSSPSKGSVKDIIAPLYTVGDPSGATSLITHLIDSVNNHYGTDRLLDLNNQNEMTLGEANIRNDLRRIHLSVCSRG